MAVIGVCMVTYNQEDYIGQAIESVLRQQCTWPIVLYIGQDCSTDHTGEICEKYAAEYPDNVVLVNRERNQGLVGNTMSLLSQMKTDGCEYIAMLDGDDYWIDDEKLQKQMDFFASHPECGLVHTCVDVLKPDGLCPDHRTKETYGNVFDCIESYTIGNCSVVFKSELLDLINFKEFVEQGFRSCDYVMYAIFASKVPFAFLTIHTAVWRRTHESVSNQQDVQRQIEYVYNDLAMWKYLAQLFPERWSYSEKAADAYLHSRGFNIAFRMGDRKRCKSEYLMLPKSNRKGLRLKYWVAHSEVLTNLWRKKKHYF